MDSETALDKRVDDYNWQHIFESGEGYTRPTHVRSKVAADIAYARTDIKKVIALVDGENDGAQWLGVFEMNDGLFLVVRAGCDYTGWGCQEGGNSDVADLLVDAIAFGLTDGERDRLKDQLL